MGLGVLEDKHLQHVPGTALLADMMGARHQYHGMLLPYLEVLPYLTALQVATPLASSTRKAAILTSSLFRSPLSRRAIR